MAFLNVAGKSYEDLASRKDLMQMGHNCNLLPIHPSIHQAMISAIERDEYRIYTPPYGFEELIELISADMAIPGAKVLVTQGATEAIFQALSVLIEPGDEIVLSDPGWPHIGNIARGLGAKLVPVPVYSDLANYKLLPSLLAEHMTPQTKVIAIVDPFNPLGASYSKSEIEQICAIAKKYGAYVLHDATYRDFATEHYSALRCYEKAVIDISLSKSCGFAGLRVGAVVTTPELLARIQDRQVARLGGNWLAQKGAIAAYKTKSEWLPKVVAAVEANKTRIAKAVGTVSGLRCLTNPSSGNFLAIDVTGLGCTSEDLVESLLRENIVVRSGNYTSERFGDAFIRVTSSVPAEYTERFAAVLPAAAERVRK
ncbi:MAG: pyridoxal phosphate-dependent aminotransferase [Vulcanimicrobiaceae bacterium]